MAYSGGTTGDYLKASFTTGQVGPGDGCTMQMWIWLSATDWSDGTLADHIMEFSGVDDARTPSFSMRLERSGADQVLAELRDESNNAIFAERDFTGGTGEPGFDGIWVPCFVRLNTDDSIDCFIGDTSVGSETNIAGTTEDWTGSLQYVYAGASASSFQNFPGYWAECAIWAKALSNAEIDSIWTGTETGLAATEVAQSDLIGYWPLDTDQSSHPDQSGNNGPNLVEVGGGETYDNTEGHPTITTSAPALLLQSSNSGGF